MNSSYTPLLVIFAFVAGIAFLTTQQGGDENASDQSASTPGSAQISTDADGAPAQSPQPSSPGPFSLGLGFGHGEQSRQLEQPQALTVASGSRDTPASPPTDTQSASTRDSEQMASEETGSAKTATDIGGAQALPPRPSYPGPLPLGLGFDRADQSVQSEPLRTPVPASVSSDKPVSPSAEEPGPVEEAWEEVKEVASDAMDAITGEDDGKQAGAVDAARDAGKDQADMTTDKPAARSAEEPGPIEETWEEVKEVASDAMQEVKEVARDAMDAISGDAEAGQTKVEKVWEEIKEAGEEAAEIFTGEDAAEKAQP